MGGRSPKFTFGGTTAPLSPALATPVTMTVTTTDFCFRFHWQIVETAAETRARDPNDRHFYRWIRKMDIGRGEAFSRWPAMNRFYFEFGPRILDKVNLISQQSRVWTSDHLFINLDFCSVMSDQGAAYWERKESPIWWSVYKKLCNL